MADYLAAKTFDSGSDLKAALESPRTYMIGKSEISESTDSMYLGTMVHTMVLEPETFSEKYFVWRNEMYPLPGESPLKKENKEAKQKKLLEVQAAGGQLVTQELFEKAFAMGTSIINHPIACTLLRNCDHREESIYVKMNIHGVERNFRIRPDAYGNQYYISLKTTKDASPDGFVREAYNYLYALSEALYYDILSKVIKGINKGYIIAVESAKPYNCTVFDILEDPAFLEYGRTLYKKAVKVIIDAGDNLDQGYEFFHPQKKVIFPLGVPEWAMRREFNSTEE